MFLRIFVGAFSLLTTYLAWLPWTEGKPVNWFLIAFMTVCCSLVLLGIMLERGMFIFFLPLARSVELANHWHQSGSRPPAPMFLGLGIIFLLASWLAYKLQRDAHIRASSKP